MNTRLFALFIIILLSVLVGCGGDSATNTDTSVNSLLNPQPQITLDDTKLQFVSIENIGRSGDVTSLLEANITPPISTNRDRISSETAVLSPDGERIIFQRDTEDIGMICVYQFTTNTSTCTDIGERIPQFNGGYWSPDGRYWVLNMDIVALQQLRDADIFIYDTQDNRLINRTDDGVPFNARFVGDEAEEIRAKVWMDIAPTWLPNGDLYFFRNAIDPSMDEWRADLMRIPASDITGSSPAEVILRHPSDNTFPVYRGSGERLDGSMSISPNGQYLAYSALTNRREDVYNGIWIIDLAQKSVKIHLDYNRLPFVMAGIPAWWIERATQNWGTSAPPLMARSLDWSDDNNRLVILLDNPALIPVPVPPLKYDVTANTLESWYDFTTIGEDDDLREITVFGDVRLTADQNLRMAIVSPTHKTVFYMGRDGRETVLSAMSISEAGFITPRRIVSLADDDVNSRILITSIGYRNGTVRILAGTNLITLREE